MGLGRRKLHASQWVLVGVLVALVLVMAATGFSYAHFLHLEQEQALADNDAIARTVAAYIEARETGYVDVLLSYAGRFRFREAIKRKDRAEAEVHLRQMQEAFPELDRPFLVDPAGVLWAAYPDAPDLYGRRFTGRDWYRGVSREWKPYMSDVFESARDGALVVALVVPVRDLSGDIIGIIGAAQRLDTIRRWLQPLQIPGGDLYLVDRQGQFVFHRTRTGPERLSDYARIPVVARLLRGEEGIAETENPVEGKVGLTAFRQFPSLGWGLVVHRNKDEALQQTRLFLLVTGGAGLLLSGALAVLGVLAIRSQLQTAAALAALQQTQQDLGRANAFLDSIVENIPNMIFVKDAKDLRFIRFNKAGEDLLGHSRDQLIGKNDYDFFPREEADFFTAKDRTVLEGRMLVDIPEEPIHTTRQETRILHTKKIPILDDAGRPQYLLGISEDITERRQAEDDLRRAREEAEQASRAKSEFLSRMSHELRTPLNSILGFAQLVQTSPLSEDDRESVGYILKGGKHLLALINEVLDIARIEAGNLALSLEPVPVQETVMAMVALVQPLAAQRRIAISVASDCIGGRYVVADRQRLQQVLLNLLANAVKFNRDDGEVRVTGDAPGAGRLRILVQDTGNGIPAEKMKRLFIPFDRLGAEQTTIEGTGLGLALSRRLVETMGGRLEVTSVVGQGSVFSVELAETVSPLGREESTLPAQPVIAEDGRRGVLLYIEDNICNVRLLERVLARRPHVKLITAMHGSLGCELARQHRPNLILLDLNLPDLPGAEVLARLRAQPQTRDIPVVILSADATPGQVRRLLADGAMTYLTKPLDGAQVLAIVDEVLAASGDRGDAEGRGPTTSMVGSAGADPPPGRPAHPEEGQG